MIGGRVPPLHESVDFIHTLGHRRYAQFKADIQNEAVAGQPWPPELQDAYKGVALNKRVDLKHAAGGTEAVFAADSGKSPRNKPKSKPAVSKSSPNELKPQRKRA